MKKILIIIAVQLILSCNRSFDHSNVYRIIQEKFPDDEFIKKSLDKASESDPPKINPFAVDFFKTDREPLDIIINESLLDLEYLQEIKLTEENINKLFETTIE